MLIQIEDVFLVDFFVLLLLKGTWEYMYFSNRIYRKLNILTSEWIFHGNHDWFMIYLGIKCLTVRKNIDRILLNEKNIIRHNICQK
jgi:hypothetical protein